MDIFDRLREHFGSLTAISTRLGFPHVSTVSNWRTKGQIPLVHCASIEAASNGAIRCEDMRPDVSWHRAADGQVLAYCVPVNTPATDASSGQEAA